MAREQYVILKGRKDGISILLDEKADFEMIKLTLRKKVAEARKFFEDANTNVAFKGRDLSEDEEKSLLDIIFTETTLDVSFVEHEDFKLAPPVPPDPEVKSPSAATPRGNYSEHITAYYRNGLRSGQSIRYNGSVVIMGDANPGSEIIASGNVVVLGALKGMVHAGAAGDDHCFVSALALLPTQLRIANIITYIPVAPSGKNKKQPHMPSYAYIQDGQVYIAPLID